MATTVVVGDNYSATSIAQRLVVWAQHDHRVRTTHTGDGRLAFVFPDDLAADAPEGYGPTIETGVTPVTVVPGSDQSVTLAFDSVSGIDPNSYNHEKDAITITAPVAVPSRPGTYRITWTTTERHAWFHLRIREAVTAPAPVNEWSVIDIPGYQRQHFLKLVEGTTYDLMFGATIREGFYVPIATAPGPVTTAP